MLEQIKSVVFELSNTCPRSREHVRCPTSVQKRPAYLPGKLIVRELHWLESFGYAGEIFFSVYNEPMADARLIPLAMEARRCCPKGYLRLLTSGWCVDEWMLASLFGFGFNSVWVSAYTDEEAKWFGAINAPLGSDYRVRRQGLDMRMENAQRGELHQTKPCGAPLAEVIVRHNGDVGLCCYDWDISVSFGNIKIATLCQILESDAVKTATVELRSGNRTRFDICKRCGSERWGYDATRNH